MQTGLAAPGCDLCEQSMDLVESAEEFNEYFCAKCNHYCEDQGSYEQVYYSGKIRNSRKIANGIDLLIKKYPLQSQSDKSCLLEAFRWFITTIENIK